MKRFLLLVFVIVVGFSISDVQKELVVLNWILENSDSHGQNTERKLTFENASFSDTNQVVPIFSKVFSADFMSNDIRIVLDNLKFEEVKLHDDNLKSILVAGDIVVDIQKVKSGGELKVHLKIIPLKRTDDKLFILKSFEVKQIPEQVKSAVRESFNWKNESVLHSGKWIKISTKERGIYKIPYSKLAEWGFSNPSQVSVFGSGGIPLLENPGEINYDDLLQNSVWHGNNKGEECLFFYAQGIVNWRLNNEGNAFIHEINHYSKNGYYFLTEGVGINLVEVATEVTNSATSQVISFDNYYVHERDLENVLGHGSGRNWYGEDMRGNSGETINVDLTNLDSSSETKFTINAIGRSSKNSNLEVAIDKVNLGNLAFSKVITDSETSEFANKKQKQFPANIADNQVEIQFNYEIEGVDNNAVAWIDYVEVNYKSLLRAGNDPVFFRDIASVGQGNIVEFVIENSSANTKVLDVSESGKTKEITLNKFGNTAKFKGSAEELNEYVVFNSDGEFLEPGYIGEVENQNLHGMNAPEYVIITHSNFINAANTLADFHRSYDGMSVEVVTADQVYNEFSSGTKSATGIRNFIKMLYDKGNSLKYVLLLGDGSYDNRNIKTGSKNFIPTYQSENSLTPTASFVTDDYFVLLDEGESVYDGAVDLGIGRIPASTTFEAELVVQKVLKYYSPEALGDWKNVVCFIGDDEDGSLHMNDSEKLANYVNKNHKEFITDKIYFDSYKEEVTPAGENYPSVNEAINNRVKDGVLVLNYVGHANNRFMADERVLDISDVNTWSNTNNLPIFVTATCEFSRFDAEETSIGEYVLFNPNGGGIGLFSTTRVVYAFSNFLLSRSFYEFVFENDENGNRYRMGDIMRLAKVNTINTTNKRNFSLLGDPALKLSYPSHKVVTTTINGKGASANPDTIGALESINIEGYIVDNLDKKLNNFSGEITLTVYDKETVMETLGNGGEKPMSFKVQENVIYKGLASVTNGDFSFSFVVPKDIAYNLGEGKIAYYARNDLQDAHGAFENFIIGGSSDNQIPDNVGPEIQLFLDSPDFNSGDKVGKSPVLYANLTDENGINTVGTGIGHDITAVLDNDYSKVFVLNSYYNANIDDYTSGSVSFPLNNLAVGKHSLKLKAWDVANNSTEVEIEFEVSGEFQINSVTNYPNPTSDYTFFTFEHNHSDATLSVIIEIFDQFGKRLDIVSTEVGSDGKISNPIRWDLREAWLQPKNGIYIYRIIAKNEDGIIASKSGKMSISY